MTFSLFLSCPCFYSPSRAWSARVVSSRCSVLRAFYSIIFLSVPVSLSLPLSSLGVSLFIQPSSLGFLPSV
ncbi:hypothetical protein VTO73DRAFT_11220 [Trametes versicolor]